MRAEDRQIKDFQNRDKLKKESEARKKMSPKEREKRENNFFGIGR